MKYSLPVSVLFLTWLLTYCQSYSDSENLTSQEKKSDLPSSALVTQNSKQWELVKEISAWTPRVTNYDTVDRKTFYQFKSDQTFAKYTTNGDTIRGFYKVQKDTVATDELLVITLDFPDDSFFYNSCLSGQERFELQGDTLVNSALACDGPKLLYVKR